MDFVFGNTGRVFDEDTSLANHGNRWLSFDVNQWIGEEPRNFTMHDSNLRRYAKNQAEGKDTSDAPKKKGPPPAKYSYPPGLADFWGNINGENSLYLYDNNDHLITNEQWLVFGNEFDHSRGFHGWDDLYDQVTIHANDYGLIDLLWLDDHGSLRADEPPGTPKQQIGPRNSWLTPEQLSRLEPMLSDNAYIYLGGCWVGSDPLYLRQCANAAQRPIVASDNQCSRLRLIGRPNTRSFGNYIIVFPDSRLYETKEAEHPATGSTGDPIDK